jgi:hypothetical protein
MATGVGTATLNFGSAPGTNVVETTVTGQTGITTSSHVEAWLMGDSTAGHNAYEHAIVPIKLSCGSLVNNTGFTITASSEWRLTGTFTAHWVWST